MSEKFAMSLILSEYEMQNLHFILFTFPFVSIPYCNHSETLWTANSVFHFSTVAGVTVLVLVVLSVCCFGFFLVLEEGLSATLDDGCRDGCEVSESSRRI